MKRQSGFTILEILVALAIVGILTATAVPLYHTWQGRAYGSEAAIMMKQLLAAEINYYLENSRFFPEDIVYSIPHEGQPDPVDAIGKIEEYLHITINQGHFLEYYIAGFNEPGNESFSLTITSKDEQFDIFKGTPRITVTMDRNGNVSQFTPYY